MAGNVEARDMFNLLLQLSFILLSVSWFGFVYFACFSCFAFLLIFHLDRFGNLLVLILAVLFFFPSFLRATEIKIRPIISHFPVQFLGG